MSVWEWDLQTDTVYWSEGCYQILRTNVFDGTLSGFMSLFHPDDVERVKQATATAIETRSIYSAEFRFIDQHTNEVRWLSNFGRCEYDSAGKPLRMVGTVQDITDRKLNEVALKASQERLAEAQRIAGIGSWAWEPQTGQVWWSEETFRLFGLDPQGTAPSYQEFLNVVHPDDRNHVEARFQALTDGANSTEHEIRIQCPDGRLLWLNSRAHATRDEEGRLIRIEGTDQDITERKMAADERVQAELALRASEARYRTLAESLPQLVWMSNTDGQLEYLNARCKEYSGLPLDDLTHWTWLDVVHPDDHDETADRWLTSLQTGLQYDAEFRLRRYDGEYRWHIVRGVPLLDEHGAIIKWFGTCTDNHDQKLAEAALRESEERLSMCVRAANEGIWDYDLRTGEVWWNDKYAEMFGGQSTSAEGSLAFWLERIHPDDRIRVQDELFGAMDGDSDRWSGEYRLRRSNGTYADVYDRALIAREPDGTSRRILGAMLDLSDRRRAETLLRAVMTSVPDAILTISETCIIKTINPATERLFGYTATELIGQSITLLLFGQDRTAQQLSEQFDSMAARVDGQPLEIFSCRRDGSGFPAELTVTDFLLEDGRFFTCVVREVSERKKLEAQFLQSQKMEAVGQLAGGVAHDFNNLLMVISGYCELILDDLPADNPHREAIMEINNAGSRAAGLTRQLLAFSRKQIMEPTSVDLNELVTRAESMIRRLIRENVIVSVKLAPFLQPIKADSVQIDQVLLNLIVNSRDAMPDGGLVTIETSMLEVFDDEQRSNGVEFLPGHYVRLSVSDTGCGMSEEVRARIFEPFFTTKAVGKGTGLGLSVVHGIVKQSGGQIRVHSLPEIGTTFEILFPAEVGRNVKPEVSDADVNGFRGSETVLLVEDEPAVRQIARQVLESHGYCVLEASHGVDALEVAARHLQPVDMLLTDMVMPEMGGRQLVEIMRSQQPSIRVLYMSGYTDDTTVLNRGDANADVLIYKPFSPKALVKKVREILDQVN